MAAQTTSTPGLDGGERFASGLTLGEARARLFALGGLVVFPRAVYRVFVRGRHSRNLYGEAWDESILTRRVGEVRHRLRLDVEEARPTGDDRLAFVKWAAASVAAYVATLVVIFVPVSAPAVVLWSYCAR
jgi:hypothetical protein